MQQLPGLEEDSSYQQEVENKITAYKSFRYCFFLFFIIIIFFNELSFDPIPSQGFLKKKRQHV